VPAPSSFSPLAVCLSPALIVPCTSTRTRTILHRIIW
jgi:hypothetical protein